MTPTDPTPGPLDRRAALAGAGVAAAALTLAAACSSNDSSSGTPSAASSSAAPAPSAGQAAGHLANVADVPVGGGVIVGDTVVTQPAAGTFEGWSTTCTHAGCKVNKIVGGLIECPCHGSAFHLDGTVAHGPAARPLDSHPVKVQGTSIVRA